MAFSLEGRRALVMGASRGLGYGIASAFVAAGAHVAMTGRKAETIHAAAASIGGDAEGFVLDSADLTQVDHVHAAVVDALGGIDILVLNSGGPPPGGAQGVSSELWQIWWNAMFVGPVRLADLALPGMLKAGHGRIITISSSGVAQPIPNLAMSNAIRPALIGWGKSLSAEVAPKGVTVNAILPGRIQTERVEEIDAANARKAEAELDAIKAQARARIPVGRYGTVDEFAATALFLASDEASFVTGSMVRCDGGQISSV